jgi:signal transduction histidine kinase
MPSPFQFRSALERLWRQRPDHRLLSLLSAGGALLASVRLADAILDDVAVGAGTVPAIAPVMVAMAGAYAMASRPPDQDDFAPIARMLKSLRPGDGADTIVKTILTELMGLAGAREAVVVLERRAGRRLFSCRLQAGTPSHRDPALKRLPRELRDTYFFPLPSSGSSADPIGSPFDPHVRVALLDTDERPVPAALTDAHPSRTMYVVAFSCAEDWHGRLFLLDPAGGRGGAFIRSFELLLSQLVPAVAGVCDLHAMRRRAATQERARLARELHDGIVQELVNMDMELELARRRHGSDAEALGDDVGRVQEQLRSQVAALRTLLQQARSHDGNASRLPALLAEVVQRFGRETGIRADYRSTVADLDLPARVCGEIVRIVQEALVNVRRHSGANHVTVEFAGGPDDLTLGIQDDGRGFAAPAPAVIAERVQSIGGTVYVLALDRGARVEVRLPRNGPWTRTARSELSLPTITRFSETG